MAKYYQSYDASADVTPTEYNSNAFTIIFLDRLNNTFSASMLGGDYRTALLALENIFAELSFKDVKGYNYEETENDIELLRKMINNSERKFKTNNGNILYLKPELREEVHIQLMNFKRYLGRLKHKLGLGLTEKDDPKFAFAADPDLHGRSVEGEPDGY